MIERPFVGLDCLALPRQFSGAANYIFALSRELLISPDRKFPIALFCKTIHKPLFRDFLKPADKLVDVPLSHRAALLYFYEVRLKKLLLREKIRLFYALHYMCPPPHPEYQIINTFHDMGFLLYPGYYPLVKRLYFRGMMHRFVARSEHMVAVSRTTAADLARLFPEKAGEITVIYPGIDHLSQQIDPDHPVDRSEKPYFLAVNTFELRKQIPFLIRVFDLIKSADRLPHRFLIAGHPANASRQVKRAVQRSPFRDDIRILSSVDESDLTRLYRNCAMFLNASVYEGFGFTPFEAMRYDKPMLLYGNAALKEVLGEQPFILSHLVPEIWARQIIDTVTNEQPFMIDHQPLNSLTWKIAARHHLRVLEASLTTGATKIVS